MKIKKAIIHTDGASRGNPGPAAIGATIRNEQGELVATISKKLGITTNNQAEYQAVIAALGKAISQGAGAVELYADSELLVKQLNGQYRVKNTGLRLLYQEAVKLIGSLESFTARHVPRSRNAEADALANKALDT